MAMALATGPITDIRPKNSMVNGTRPTVTAHCVRAALAKLWRNRTKPVAFSSIRCVLPAVAYRIQATAPNDSQKPGFMRATGSKNRTIPAADRRIWEKRVNCPLHNASATMAIMQSVLLAGMPKPASAT